MLSFIAGRTEYLFGTAAMDRLLQLSPSFTERSAVGAQIARLGSFEAIRELFTSPIAVTLLELPATLLIAVILCIINPVALPIILFVLAVYAVSYFVLEPLTKTRVNALGRILTERNEFLVEMVTKMRGIRESRAEQAWLNRYRLLSADAAMAGFRVEQMAAILSNFAYAVMMAAGLLLIAFTTPLVFETQLGAGALIASLMLIWRVLGPLQVMFTNLSRIERVRSAAQQFDTLMQLKGERLAPDMGAIAKAPKGALEFTRVSFRYSMQADPALVGISVQIPAGSSIAITGQNGGGKSTFLKLLLGMYTPQAGTIRIDGVDIRQIDPVTLRRMVGYVPQDLQFFRATIAQNLRFAQPDATDEELREALELAGAWAQISALPNGLNYRIGDGASEQLPASLRLKMAFARAYLTRAQILLFDEPAAGLDAESDASFAAVLEVLKGRRTVIFISHRPSHIKIADSVLLFRAGYLQGTAKPQDLFRPAA
jgi:ATP-binding cassette subfamily B protein